MCSGNNFLTFFLFFNRADVWKIIRCFIKGLIRVCSKQVQQLFTADIFENSLTNDICAIFKNIVVIFQSEFD